MQQNFHRERFVHSRGIAILVHLQAFQLICLLVIYYSIIPLWNNFREKVQFVRIATAG